MAKKSGKSNAFPVEEAINAAAHFDVTGPRAGIVELLSGIDAMSKFYSMRADGQYFKPHQIYFAVYRPKDEYRVPVPAKHHMQSKGTITSCAKAHPDVFDAEPDYNTFIKYLDVGEAPAGTPFFMKFLTGDDIERFGITGTIQLDDEKYYKNTQRRMRTYIATRIIPKMGRSILRDSVSRFGLKTKGNTTEPITCTEEHNGVVCGGVFRKDGRGDYVCQNCGLIYEREDKFVAEDLTVDIDIESESDEDVLEAATSQKDLEVGGMLPGALMALEARLARNIQSWRKSIATAPKDEVAAKEHQHEVKVADMAARKAATSAKRKDNNVRDHDVYEGKWNMLSTNAIIAKVLYFLRFQGVITVSGLTNVMKVHRMYVVRALDTLEAKGRVTRTVQLKQVEVVDEDGNKSIVEVEGTGKGKVILVKYNPTGKEYVGRAAKSATVPVLPQVRYGGIQRTTVNYRNSSISMKMGIPFDGEHPTTLYTRKE